MAYHPCCDTYGTHTDECNKSREQFAQRWRLTAEAMRQKEQPWCVCCDQRHSEMECPNPLRRSKTASEFQECTTCRAKPGSPVLCAGCLANRATIERLKMSHHNGELSGVNRERAKVGLEPLEPLDPRVETWLVTYTRSSTETIVVSGKHVTEAVEQAVKGILQDIRKGEFRITEVKMK